MAEWRFTIKSPVDPSLLLVSRALWAFDRLYYFTLVSSREEYRTSFRRLLDPAFVVDQPLGVIEEGDRLILSTITMGSDVNVDTKTSPDPNKSDPMDEVQKAFEELAKEQEKQRARQKLLSPDELPETETALRESVQNISASLNAAVAENHLDENESSRLRSMYLTVLATLSNLDCSLQKT